MLRITILLVTFIIIQLFNNLIFADSNKQLKIEDNIIIKNESDAVNRALEFSGFDKLKDFDIEKAKGKVELMIARDSTTPFLADSINGKIAWSIEFKDVILDLDQTTYEQEIANPLSFVILIDAESGRLLRFESIHTELIIPSHKVVPIKVAEYQLAINGSEMYHSLPLIIP